MALDMSDNSGAVDLSNFASGLAGEMDGNDNIGKAVEQPAAQKADESKDVIEGEDETVEGEDEIDDVVDEVSDDEVKETGDEREETEDEDEDEDEDEEKAAEAEEEESSEEPEFESLSDFAEALEISDDDLLDNIKATVKIDGEEKQVTLRELQNGYQKEADYRRKTGDLAEQRREFETHTNQVIETYDRRIEEINQLAESLFEMSEAKYNSINWDELREKDPGQYAAMREDQKSERQALQQALVEIQMKKDDIAKEWQEKLQKEVIPAEAAKFVEKAPEFGTRDGWESNWKKLTQCLIGDYGFDQEEVSSVVDHRMLYLASDAMKYRESLKNSEKKVTEIKKEVSRKRKLRASSKTLQPGQKKPTKTAAAKTRNEKQVGKLVGRIKKTGDVGDFANLLMVD